MTQSNHWLIRPHGPRTSAVSVSAAFVCDNCRALSVAFVNYGEHPGQLAQAEQGEWQGWASAEWSPRQGEGREFPDVPAHIADTASEAYRCLSINAFRGAVALARAVVEATAKEHGHTKGNLNTKIDALVDSEVLRKATGAVAHEVRHWGNDAAHGDVVEPIEREEADSVLELMAKVLDEAFQTPALLARVRSRRTDPATE